jgi:hypothetical protein
MLVNELNEQNEFGIATLNLPAEALLYDVCIALGLDPRAVLGPEAMGRIKRRGDTRLWPTLTVAEDEEMVELAGIREPVEPDEITPVWDEYNLYRVSAL